MKNNNEFIASLLVEAADLIDESAGMNGLSKRFYEEKAKSEKIKNDKHDAETERKREMYEKAGYGDKAPQKADRSEENEFRDAAKDVQRIKDFCNKNKGKVGYGYKMESKQAGKDALNMLVGYDHDDMRAKLNKRNFTEKEVNKRINDRARRTQNEAVASLLVEAASLISGQDYTYILDEAAAAKADNER